MNEYCGIIKRVEQYEKKCEISYAKSGGKLFKTLAVVCAIFTVYMFFVNTIACVSFLMKGDIVGEYNYFGKSEIIFMMISNILLPVCSALIFSKNNAVKAVSIALLTFQNIYMFVRFCLISNDGLSPFGFKAYFYWRHLLPFAAVLLCSVWMLTIILRQKMRFRRRYKKILDDLYEAYKNNGINLNTEPSDELWEEFIKNYDPTNMKN